MVARIFSSLVLIFITDALKHGLRLATVTEMDVCEADNTYGKTECEAFTDIKTLKEKFPSGSTGYFYFSDELGQHRIFGNPKISMGSVEGVLETLTDGKWTTTLKKDFDLNVTAWSIVDRKHTKHTFSTCADMEKQFPRGQSGYFYFPENLSIPVPNREPLSHRIYANPKTTEIDGKCSFEGVLQSYLYPATVTTAVTPAVTHKKQKSFLGFSFRGKSKKASPATVVPVQAAPKPIEKGRWTAFVRKQIDGQVTYRVFEHEMADLPTEGLQKLN